MSVESLFHVRFLFEETVRVRDLPAFQKHHHVPTSCSENDRRFVHELAESLIEKDLDDRFFALRSQFELKRKQINVQGPNDGTGVIKLPYFDYSIWVELQTDDSRFVKLSRAIEKISDFDSLLTPQFQQVFGNLFSLLEVDLTEPLDLEEVVDAIEDSEGNEIKVDYDRDLTWCKIEIRGCHATVQLTDQSIQISGGESIQELLKTFGKVKELIRYQFGAT